MFCAGTFERVLDAKQRMLLPKAVKKSFSAGENLFLAPGLDQCLEIHNADSIEIRAAKVRNSATDIRIQKSFSRLYFAQAEKCDLDSQNRIRIPQRLVDWAKLESRIVILGTGDVWEIWGECGWQEYCQRHRHDFDMIAQELAASGASPDSPTATEQSENLATLTKPK